MAEDALVSGHELLCLADVFLLVAEEGAELETLPDPDNGESVNVNDLDEDPARWPVRVLRDVPPGWTGTRSLDDLQRQAQVAAHEHLAAVVRRYDHALDAYEQRQLEVAEAGRHAEQARPESILLNNYLREQVSRYETTLERSLIHTLAELRLLRAARAPQPTVVEVGGNESSGG
jgi:hypothetical protein